MKNGLQIHGNWLKLIITGAGAASSLFLQGGQFTFFTSGRLEYIDEAGHLYKGSWNLRNVKKDSSGSRDLLFIAIIDFSREEVRSVIFDDIVFSGDEGFKAYVDGGTDSFRLHFKKM